MKSDGLAADVLVVGGGYSGTMVAAELARHGIDSIVVAGGGREGRGTAYSTSEEAHLLNVPAARMGAWADQPADFAEAVAGEGVAADAFVPRRRYGDYLHGVLRKAERGGLVRVARTDAVSAVRENGDWVVSTADGRRATGRTLVLAQGNQPPEPPAIAVGLPPHLMVNDPWSDAGRDAMTAAAASGGDVLIIGTGLTMVDVVLSLDEAGHRGRIVALSRRGQVPRPHAGFEPAPVALDVVPQGSVAKAWRWLRRRAAEVGWRAAVDSLRPHSQALWRGWSEREQRRFLRHARPWWDVHRHRIAPEVATRIRGLVEAGKLKIVAGRVNRMTAGNPKLVAAIQCRGSEAEMNREFALAINCTGPLGSIGRSEDGVLRGLFDAGFARADALGLGIAVDDRSRVIGAERAWALGPLTKGQFWEITAVPDIRVQVAHVADQIAEELKR